MSLEKLNSFTFNHSAQQDKLYEIMTAPKIKEAFDSRGEELRVIYNKLIDDLLTDGAKEIGISSELLLSTNVKGAIEELKNELVNVVLGEIPYNSITDNMLSNTQGQIKERLSLANFEIEELNEKVANLELPPMLEVSTSKTLQILDTNKILKCTNVAPITINIPKDTNINFPIGSEIAMVQYNTGAVTIAGESGVSIKSNENLTKIGGQNSSVVIKKITNNEWLLVGSLQ